MEVIPISTDPTTYYVVLDSISTPTAIGPFDSLELASWVGDYQHSYYVVDQTGTFAGDEPADAVDFPPVDLSTMPIDPPGLYQELIDAFVP